MIKPDIINKFIIVENLQFNDFMKDNEGNIKLFDTEHDALMVCGMYEFPNAIILEIKNTHKEEINYGRNKT